MLCILGLSYVVFASMLVKFSYYSNTEIGIRIKEIRRFTI